MMKIMKIAELIRTLESDASDELKLKQIHHACNTDVITEEEAIELVCEYNVRKPVAKKLIANIDLRKQVDNVKGLWFYEDYKDRLKINKHSVTFDKSFHFTLKEYDYSDLCEEGETYDALHENTVAIQLDGHDLMESYDYYTLYGYGDYLTDPSNILKHITCYIANYI